MKEPRGQELINRYRWNYGIRADASITEEMILEHWNLERCLTKELLGSNPENRWETFERCYTTLYSRIDWLNQYIDSDKKISPDQRYHDWAYLIGKPPKKIYEIGSGKGDMISYLATIGHKCQGTEITRERGKIHVRENPNLSWDISDGVHFERFEIPGSYNVVVSDQVIEHIHPDDLSEHFKGVLSILSKDGKYIFATPHVWYGPWDISKVFKYDKAMGMHLKEYTYQEIKELSAAAGFRQIYAVHKAPWNISRLFHLKKDSPKISRFYLSYLCLVEKLFSLIPRRLISRRMQNFGRAAQFCPNIFVVAQK